MMKDGCRAESRGCSRRERVSTGEPRAQECRPWTRPGGAVAAVLRRPFAQDVVHPMCRAQVTGSGVGVGEMVAASGPPRGWRRGDCGSRAHLGARRT